MKIIIAGCGKVGASIAEQLCREKHNITIIDKDENRIRKTSDTLDVMCLNGDAKSVAVLKSAGIETADLMIAVTDADEENLFICLLAANLGARSTIARTRNPVLGESIGIVKDSLGLSMSINPDLEAADEMFRTLRFKSADQVETFAKSKMEILTCPVKEGTLICDTLIKDLHKKMKSNIFICAMKRNDEVFIPNGMTEIKAGDTLSFLATANDATVFFKNMGYDTNRIKNLAIIGGGRLGYYLGKKAIENGIPLKMVELSKDICKELDANLPGADVVCGDGSDTGLLTEEGILNYSAIAVVTGDDAANTLISMYLRKKAENAKVITKIKRADFEDLIYNLDLGSVFNPKYITADHILRYVRAMNSAVSDGVTSLCHIIDNKVEVLEFSIKEEPMHLGIKLQDLHFKKNLLLAAILRKGRSFVPNGSDTIEEGDGLLVITTTAGISRFSDIFEK